MSAPVLLEAASHQGKAAAHAGRRYLHDQHDQLDHKLRVLSFLGGLGGHINAATYQASGM